MTSTQAKISFFIYSLDFLSGTKNFRLFDREKNVSLVGLIFTIILAIITLVYSAIEILNYFQETNFSLISMEDNSEQIDATKFIGNDTLAALRFIKYDVDEEENEIEVEIPDLLKIFKIKVQQFNYEYDTDHYEYKYYDMENCSKYYKSEDFEKFNLPEYIISQSVCPPKDKELKLRWNQNGISKLYFEVKLCNKSEDENCYSKEEIEEKYNSSELDNIAFGFIQEFGIIDNYNHSYPIKTESLLTEGDIYLENFFNSETKSKFIHYQSDDGIIFSNIKNYTGLRYDTVTEKYKDRDIFDYEIPLLKITYLLDMNYVLNYKRTYVKLTTVIVDISGIARVLFLIGGYIISFLGQNFFSYQLFDEIFMQKYKLTYPDEEKKNNIQIHEDISSQFSSNKNMSKDSKINIYNIPEYSNKNGSENKFLRIKKRKVKKGKNKKNDNPSTNIIINEGSSDITDVKDMDKDNNTNTVKKVDNEKYSLILSQYLGYNAKTKKKFTFFNFIGSEFYNKSNKTKVINSCAKMINNYLSLEKIINTGINIDLLLAHCESDEHNNIEVFNKIIDDDFKKTIKDIKEKKE